MSTLTDLIDRLERGGEPSECLDAKIAAHHTPDVIGWQGGFQGARLADAVARYIDNNYDYLASIAILYNIPGYTVFVDDALTLKPEGWSVLEISECVTHYRPESGWFCSIMHLETKQVIAAKAHTLPLAICIACLRASVGEER